MADEGDVAGFALFGLFEQSFEAAGGAGDEERFDAPGHG
jgi:hypothetical protein